MFEVHVVKQRDHRPKRRLIDSPFGLTHVFKRAFERRRDGDWRNLPSEILLYMHWPLRLVEKRLVWLS